MKKPQNKNTESKIYPNNNKKEKKIISAKFMNRIIKIDADIKDTLKTKKLKLKNLDLNDKNFNKQFDNITNSMDAKITILVAKREEIEQHIRDRNIIVNKKVKKLLKQGIDTLSWIRRANNKKRAGAIKVQMEHEDNILEMHNGEKYYTTGRIAVHILKGVSFEIKKGEFVILNGKSGSGKSTLLNVMSGLDRLTKGNINIMGSNISCMRDFQITTFRKQHVGFIFQRYNLLPNLNSFENVETGSYLQKDRTKRLDITDLFKMMEIENIMYKFPSETSGGQQQRVSIARALVKNPEIIFADEPTGALDDNMSKVVMNILQDINRKYNTTIIMVSHNPVLSPAANKVITLKNGYLDNIKINKNPLDANDLDW